MSTPTSTLIARARQGDAHAIAQLLTPSLSAGVVARGQWRGTMLHLDLEAETAIPQNLVVPHIRRGLMRLGLTCPIDGVWVSGRQTGADTADWQECFSLTGAFNPADAQAAGAAEDAISASPPAAAENAESTALLQDFSTEESDPPPVVSTPPAHSASDKDREGMPNATLVALTHLVPLVSYLAVGGQWLGGWPLFWGSSFLLPWRLVAPLALLLAKGAGSGANPNAAFVQSQAKAALNFQLTMLIAWIVTIALMFVLVGFLLVVPLALIEIVSCIVATTQAAEGKPVRYAIAIRFVR
ncbi:MULTISPECIES: DUF4870 domain-containing protein [Cyanophyceae]|uniref:DUF4870 domain-containing protein n=1 Tax=Leptolyngbya subtilissima DQ-A4 TaxID=2933933 RepID=A0ABV0K2C7_9CYAN|nr:DUF4870 domain-containing protein [Nodosilinea sp. FACHB-141]MBD2111702.1 DUF4870 domain-containing protein [Nodosilinea sp. FACHB-141]